MQNKSVRVFQSQKSKRNKFPEETIKHQILTTVAWGYGHALIKRKQAKTNLKSDEGIQKGKSRPS